MKYFEQFFEEKNLPFQQWEIADNSGNTHIISNEDIIEMVKQTEGAEAEAIKKVLVKLDFANADINKYLRFLAERLIKEVGR